MSEWAVIKEGRIDNVILAEPDIIEAHGAALADGGELVELIEGVTYTGQRPGPGWTRTRSGDFERGDA